MVKYIMTFVGVVVAVVVAFRLFFVLFFYDGVRFHKFCGIKMDRQYVAIAFWQNTWIIL